MRKVYFLFAVLIFVSVSKELFAQSTPGVFKVYLLKKDGSLFDFASNATTGVPSQSDLYYGNGDSTVYTWVIARTSGQTGISHTDFLGLSCLNGKTNYTIQYKTSRSSTWSTQSNSGLAFGADNAQNCTSSTDIMKVPQSAATDSLFIKVKLVGGYFAPSFSTNNIVVKVGGSGGACSTSQTFVPACTATTVCNLSASATPGTISCFGGSTTISSSASNGTSPYTYSWSGTSGATGTNSSTSAKAGTYSVIVTDANNCTATASGTITQPTAIIATPTAGKILCYGGSTTVSVSASGGTTPYKSYAWSGTSGATGTASSTSASMGSYSVIVTDNNNCTATASGTITQPTAVTASVEVPSIACNAGTTTITISGSGGTSPYRYSINAGEYKQSSNVFTGISAGAYSVTVTDANGCSSTSTDVTVSQPAVLTASASAGTILCKGGSTTITVTGSGGTAPYTYSNETGTYSVTAGKYSYMVTDANGCTATTSETTVSEPTAVTASVEVPSIACNAGTTTITISGSGGTSPYRYSINAGEYKQSSNVFTGISAGAYSVTVTDANGCSSTSTDVTVSQPAVLTASASAGTILCKGGSTTITVTGSGGTAPYTYSNETGTYSVTAGKYSYMVTDANGCTATTSETTVSEPTALSATTSKTDVLCNGASTGAIDLTVSGGSGTRTYAWSNNATTEDLSGLVAGTYNVTVTDANGCTATTSDIKVTEPTLITADVTSSNISCAGLNDGSILVSNASGGNGSYTYKLNSSVTNSTGSFSNLAPGTYTVSVIDKNKCTYTTSVTILEGKVCDPYYTYSQGYFGNKNYSNVTANGGTMTKVDFIKKAINTAGGLVKFGNTTNKVTMGSYDPTFDITYTRLLDDEIKSLTIYLPSGGTPSSLQTSLNLMDKRLFNTDGTLKSTNGLVKNGKFNNTLFGQTVTMWINIYANPMLGQTTGNAKILEAFKDFDLSGLECKSSIVTTYPAAGNKINTGNELVVTSFPQNVVKYLVAKKYASNGVSGTALKDLVQLGIDALGQPSTATGMNVTYSNVKYTVTYAEITAALDAIVTAFHGGMFFKEFRGTTSCNKITPPSTVTSKVQSGSSTASENGVTTATAPPTSPAITNANIKAKVYPNPYTDRVNFQVTAKQEGKASLILYNMNGQRVATIFEGEMKAGTQTFNYNVPASLRHGLIYIFRQNGQAESGKLFGLK